MGVSKIVGLGFVLLTVCHPAYLRGVDSLIVWSVVDADDVMGLQNLWAAWNTSTPNRSSNLLNWRTPAPEETIYPCYNGGSSWRGVECMRFQFNATLIETWVVGLALNDASISGTLPPGISQLNKLVTLTLTGNPNLGGNLPNELGNMSLNIINLHNNGINGTIPQTLSNLHNLQELDLSENQYEGDFPFYIFGRIETLQMFNIAGNSFSGNVPSNAFENMTLLTLNLSRNNFTDLPELPEILKSWLPQKVLDLSGLNIGGNLPADWSSFPEELYLDDINISGVLDIKSIQSGITNLTKDSNSISRILSLMNNNITDVIFDKQLLNSSDWQIIFYLQGNPYCTTASTDPDGRRCFCEQHCAISVAEPSKKSDYKAIIIPTVICGFLLGAMILYLVIIIHQKNKHVHALVKRFEQSDVRAKRFEYNELRTATKNFAEEMKLGEGAFGAVYKGILTNNTEVAVKQLFMKTHQASEDFLNEVLLITNLQHRNLVALKGYCLHGKEMLLVCEFVDYCDLDKLLFQGSKSAMWCQELGWPARKHICLGIAQGLYYLHASSWTKIIHRDIKASNILLDKNLNAKIADFGLARPIEDQKPEIVTQQRAGTLGYVAPEYILYGHLSEKADVYSFGVLLLEIVSGTRNKDPTQEEDDIYLPIRACKLHMEDRLMDLMDPRVCVSEGEEMEVRQVLETAVMCVQTSPEKRPTMFRVVAMLAGNANNDATVPIDASNDSWPAYQMPSGFCSEAPLLRASSTTRSTSTRPITNGNATVELSTLFAR